MAASILGTNAVVSAIMCLIIKLLWSQHITSFAIGTVFAFIILGGWMIVWSPLKHKKFIALVLLFIVSKYAIFAVSLYWLVQVYQIETLWFIFGTTSLIPTALVLALKEANK